MTELARLKFYATQPHSCSYLPEEQATTLFLDPSQPMDVHVYADLSEMGFRRSGDHLYRPHCQNCNACVPARIPSAQFIANLQRPLQIEPAAFNPIRKVRLGHCLGADLHVIPVRPQVNDRQTDPIACNRGPHIDLLRVVPGPDPRPQIAFLAQCAHHANVCYDPCEHLGPPRLVLPAT